MKLILIRHGRSLANEENQHQGRGDSWSDTSLHKRGIVQAKDVAKRFKDEKIDFIYSSPLKRTFETAKEIAKYHKHLEIKIDSRLRELMDDEKKEDFIKRCKSFLNDTKKQKKTFLVVSHGGVIMTLLAISTGNREEGRKLVKEIMTSIGNTSVSIIEEKGRKFERILIGDTSHRSDRKNIFKKP